MADDLTNGMLIFIGVLCVCLFVSMWLHKKQNVGGQHGWKCMAGALGPNKGFCMKVNEAPNKENNIYSPDVFEF